MKNLAFALALALVGCSLPEFNFYEPCDWAEVTPDELANPIPAGYCGIALVKKGSGSTGATQTHDACSVDPRDCYELAAGPVYVYSEKELMGIGETEMHAEFEKLNEDGSCPLRCAL